MNLFYTPEILSSQFAFPPEEAHHLRQVFRGKAGQKILVTDGKGNICEGEIDLKGKKEVLFTADKKSLKYHPPAPTLKLAIAPTKNIDRLEWLIEKCTELGVREFIPFISEHSERRHLRADRLERIALAAMKQSQRVWLPNIKPLTTLHEVLKNQQNAKKCIAHCYDVPKKAFAEQVVPQEDILILVGPEGDFSETEVELCIEKHECIPVSLGSTRLRTETAGLLAAATFYLKSPDQP